MARKPTQAPDVDDSTHKDRTEIANNASRSEKVAWERQFNNMKKILENEIQPIEAQIVELISKKNVHFDEMSVIRDELVKNCIHPYEHIAEIKEVPGYYEPLTLREGGTYVCKFCNKKVALNDITK